jgi:signal transduction histidine kinase
LEAAEPGLVGSWDVRRLERVLANLLENAVKYSPDGGEIVVRVARDDADSTAVLQVADTGVGIPAADLPHVFERFYRAGNVGEIQGTGIGLAGVRQIVEQHAGSIAVESCPGIGSTFTVRLPL